MVIRRTVLHIMHFAVFRYLQDGPVYNTSGYMQVMVMVTDGGDDGDDDDGGGGDGGGGGGGGGDG